MAPTRRPSPPERPIRLFIARIFSELYRVASIFSWIFQRVFGYFSLLVGVCTIVLLLPVMEQRQCRFRVQASAPQIAMLGLEGTEGASTQHSARSGRSGRLLYEIEIEQSDAYCESIVEGVTFDLILERNHRSPVGGRLETPIMLFDKNPRLCRYQIGVTLLNPQSSLRPGETGWVRFSPRIRPLALSLLSNRSGA